MKKQNKINKIKLIKSRYSLIKISTFFGFGGNMKLNNNLEDEIFITEEEGFTDIVAVVIEAIKKESRYIIRCGGNFEGKKVEIILDIPQMFEAGIVGNEPNQRAFTNGCLILQGEEGTSFAKMFSKVYCVNSGKIEDINVKREITIFPLMENRSYVESDTIFTKIFFDNENEMEQYGELFLNISLSDKIVEFNEKDIEYRYNIVKNLSI